MMVTDRRNCGQETAARFAQAAGAAAFLTTWSVSNDGIPGFMWYQSKNWLEDFSDIEIPCFEIQTKVTNKIFKYENRLKSGSETNRLSAYLDVDKNPWPPIVNHPITYVVRAIFCLVGIWTIILCVLRLLELRPNIPPETLWILTIEIFANFIRILWYAIDPANMGRIFPAAMNLLLYQFTLPLASLTTLLIANVWYRASSMAWERVFDLNYNIILLVGLFLFILQLVASCIQLLYIDSIVVTVNVIIQIVVELICVVFFVYAGFKVLSQLGKFTSHRNVQKTITFQLLISAFGILWVVAITATFITSYAYTPGGWLLIFFGGYAGVQLTSTMQVLAMKLLGNERKNTSNTTSTSGQAIEVGSDVSMDESLKTRNTENHKPIESILPDSQHSIDYD